MKSASQWYSGFSMKKAIYKVPGGKLLKISLEENGTAIGKIKIMGDFFAYPEEAIEKLEKTLEGLTLNETELASAITTFLKKEDTKLFGLDSESLAKTIISAHTQLPL